MDRPRGGVVIAQRCRDLAGGDLDPARDSHRQPDTGDRDRDDHEQGAGQAEQRGAGEILFTSMNHDGTKNGFANEALAQLSQLVNIPIIASGGAGNIQHFVDTFIDGKADAALAASVFHFKEIEIKTLKKELKNNTIEVRI